MSPIELLSMKPRPTASPLETCVTCVHQRPDPATPEQVRCAMEPKLLAQLPALQASGVFELFELRNPALRIWLADELNGTEAAAKQGRPDFLLEQT